MELTPGIIIVIVIAIVVAGFGLLLWTRRHEAAPPATAPVSQPAATNSLPPGNERESYALADWLLDRASEQTGVRVADDALARQRIVEAAFQAMEDLRNRGSATVNLPFLIADHDGPKHFEARFKRNQDSTFELQR